MARERVTACLIVQNEQERLPAALDSVAFCDEVIVVDGGSSDGTVEIARRSGARVIESPWPGFAVQRNIALDGASGEWVLEIDADERISPVLRAGIEAMLAAPPANADMAVFALRNHFLGGPLGPSAKYPAYRSRLFRRGAYRHDEARAVHEGLELRARPLILEGDLEHELAGDLREALADMWRYARLESMHLRRPSSPLAYLKGMLLRPVAKLLYRAIVDRGWRDGWRGMLKISLDVTSDALVWAIVLLHGGAAEPDAAEPDAAESRAAEPGAREPARGEPGHQHFGRRRVGPVKVVAVAGGQRSAQAGLARLLELQERGADVALIAQEAPAGCEIPVHAVGRLGPLTAIRALEAEMHVRPIDTVVPVGRRARLVMSLLPGSFRPNAADLDGEESLRWSG